MLDIDTLNALDNLMANTLYNAEVARLPKLTRAEEAELVTRARRGDASARAALVESCLHYALGKARHYYNTRLPAHDDMLDLVQVASLEMVNDLDTALAKKAPAPYLRGIAARAISIYLTYRSEFIRKPLYFTRDKLLAFEFPKVERLDVPAYRNRTRLKVDIIEVAPLPDDAELEGAEQREARNDRRFAPLYEALQKLTPHERNGIIQRYGLDPDLMDNSITVPGQVSTFAARKLRKALEGHLTQMLNPGQE